MLPTRSMANRMNWHLQQCRELYNKLLRLEIVNYQLREKFILYNELSRISKTETGINSQVKQTIAKRLDLSLRKFFRDKKITKCAGFPHFKGKNQYTSWVYPQSTRGFKVQENKIRLSGLGTSKFKMHRPIPEGGKIKTCTIKKELGKWFVIFTTDIPDKVSIARQELEVGLDVGCKDIITTSYGEKIENPKFMKKMSVRISLLQRKKDTTHNIKTKNSLSRKMRKLYKKVHRQREDFLHKLSYKIVHRYSRVYVEDLKVRRVANKTKEKSLRKSILNSGWYSFVQKLSYKSIDRGVSLIKVNPRNTTKMCSNCGKVVPKTLNERVHKCGCGLMLDRDHNAALNILRLGRESLVEKPKRPALLQSSLHNCSKMLLNFGIQKVFYTEDYPDPDNHEMLNYLDFEKI